MALTESQFITAREKRDIIYYRGGSYFVKEIMPVNTVVLVGTDISGKAATVEVKLNQLLNEGSRSIEYVTTTTAQPHDVTATKQQIYGTLYGQSKAETLWSPQEKARVEYIYSTTTQTTKEGEVFTVPPTTTGYPRPVTPLNIQKDPTISGIQKFHYEVQAKSQVFGKDNLLLGFGLESARGISGSAVGLEQIATSFPKDPFGTIKATAIGTVSYFYFLPSNLLSGKTTIGRTVGEFASMALISKGVGKVASIIREPPLKIGRYGIETAKGKVSYTYAGLEVGKYSLFLKKPTIIEKITVSELEGGLFRPFTKLETKIVKSAIAFDEPSLTKIEAGTTLVGLTERQASAFVRDTFIRETTTLSPKGVETVLSWAKTEGKNVETIYGTFAARPQMTGFKAKVPTDIDVQLRLSGTAAEASAYNLVTRLKAVGEDVRLSPEKPLLIEVKGGTGGKPWVHAVDIHSKDMVSGVSEMLEGGYGYKFGQPPIKIEGLPAMRLSEQGMRKVISSIGISKRGVFPEAHRFKDIAGGIETQRVLIESMKKSPFATFNLPKIIKAEKALKDYEAAFATELKGIAPPKEIKLPIYISPSRAAYSVPIPFTISRPVSSPSISRHSSSMFISPSVSKSVTYKIPSPSIKTSVSASRSVSEYSKPVSVYKQLSYEYKSSPVSGSLFKPSPSPSRSVSRSISPSVSPSVYISPSPSLKSLRASMKSGFSIPSLSSRRAEIPKSERGFIPYVKRRGLFFPLSKEPLTKLGALGLGAEYVESTPSATFFIREVSAKEVFETGKRLKIERFYRKGEKYIERSKYRINTAGEIFGITYKGIKARRTKIRIPRF